MLSYRLATSAVMISALVGVLILDQRFAPWFPLWFLTAAVVMTKCSLEFVGLLRAIGMRPSANTVVGGGLALIAANWMPHLIATTSASSLAVAYDFSAHAFAWPMWAFATIVMATFLGQSAQFQGTGGVTASIAGTILATSYVGLLGSFIIQMRWLDGPYDGLIPLLLLLFTAKGADTGAYAIGRLAGRHKLWPRLSPNKTIEGSIGGMLFGVLGAALVVGCCRLASIPTLSWPATIGYGVVVGIAAQLGDLMESMIKRDCARKDAAGTLPGFGGLLDVLDSLLFAGPVAYGYWLMFGA